MFSKRKLYYAVSPSMRYLLRRLYYFPQDLWRNITGQQDHTTPPKGLIFIGSGDFKKIGAHYLEIFKTHCGLQPDHHVLDIGCGIGRIAVPLTRYLNHQGSYSGFDIVKKGIDWCNKHITPTYPNFNFLHIDLRNDLYNLKTDAEAKNFIFPYADKQFDLAVLTSVFTHMMPDDVEHYLSEIHRVLKPGGKCLATFFILNDVSITCMKESTEFDFKYNYGTYSLIDEDVKEANIAFDEKYLLQMISECQLHIDKKLYGFWSGRPKHDSFDFQDTLILSRK